MKRPVTLIAVPLTVLALAACGGSSHKKAAAGNPTPPATTATSPPAASTPPTTAPATPQPPATSTSATIDLAADPSGQLKYTASTLSAKAGKVTIDFTNTSPLPHDIVLIDAATYSPTAKVLGKTPIFQGGSKSFTVTLTSGKYTYYCSVPGHRQAGMQGTLTVS